MEDTGRIRKPLDRRARQIVFGDHVEQAIRDELPFYVQIDRAHLVMLLERGILPREAGRRLLAVMDDLTASGYAPLRGRPAPRGLYLLYESWLVETLGEDVGGAVHLARSRNDINATVLRLRLRGAGCRQPAAAAPSRPGGFRGRGRGARRWSRSPPARRTAGPARPR